MAKIGELPLRGLAGPDRLNHARRIETASARELDRFGRGFECDRDLIGELGHLSRARRAHYA
jgi:hypothetical protein